jgi:hypothetical protein
VARSTKSAGRLDFVLRILVFSALAFALEYLLRGDILLPANILPRFLRVSERVIAFGLVGIYLLRAIDGRLLDTGLSRWYRYLAFAIWLLSTSLPIIWFRTWPIGLALFAFLLLAGGLIPSKSVLVESDALGRVAVDDEKVSAKKDVFPPLPRVGPIGFLRSLLTLACLWLPMILLDDASGRGTGMWVARLGYFILGVVWLIKAFGRLEDAGRSPHMGRGYFIVGGVLLIEMLRHLVSTGWSSQSYGLTFSNVVQIVSMLPSWLKLINGYEKLALFLLIQIPLALLPSKPRPDELVPAQKVENKYGKRLEERRKVAKPFLVAPFSFLRRLLVIVFLWTPLVYMDSVSNGEIGTWIARLGYFILIYVWLMNASGRFEDAGWAFNWDGAQYCLVVSVASLMPLAVHWINGYESLALFVLIQIPTLLLKSKPKPEEPLLESDERVAQV